MIIDRIVKTLLAPEVSLRRLNWNVTQQKLNLLQFTAGPMAKAGASPAEVVQCERRNLTILCFLFHDTPNDLGAKAPRSFRLFRQGLKPARVSCAVCGMSELMP